MIVNLAVDADRPAEIERARAILDCLLVGVPARPNSPLPDLAQWCAENLDPQFFGATRLETVRLIAERSPEQASIEEVYSRLRELDPSDSKDPSRMMGGLHKTLEGSWRKAGLDARYGCFFETLKSGFRMSEEVAAAVRAALDGSARAA